MSIPKGPGTPPYKYMPHNSLTLDFITANSQYLVERLPVCKATYTSLTLDFIKLRLTHSTTSGRSEVQIPDWYVLDFVFKYKEYYESYILLCASTKEILRPRSLRLNN